MLCFQYAGNDGFTRAGGVRDAGIQILPAMEGHAMWHMPDLQ